MAGQPFGNGSSSVGVLPNPKGLPIAQVPTPQISHSPCVPLYNTVPYFKKCSLDPFQARVGSRCFMVNSWWATGTAIFLGTEEGYIIVQRKDGTYKYFKPKKSLVISSNPKVATLLKADKQLTKMVSGMKSLKARRTGASTRSSGRKPSSASCTCGAR